MKDAVTSYCDLIVWQRAMDLTVACYRAATRSPREETYGLASQLRRAAASVPANIAEGHGRSYTKDYIRFLSIAHGSLMELETHVRLAYRLSYIEHASELELLGQTRHVGRMLHGLMNALQRKVDSEP
jgi:four helix bundle protein